MPSASPTPPGVLLGGFLGSTLGKSSHFGPNGPNFLETDEKRLRNGYEKRSKDEAEYTQRFA
jgi:hypothetical protein